MDSYDLDIWPSSAKLTRAAGTDSCEENGHPQAKALRKLSNYHVCSFVETLFTHNLYLIQWFRSIHQIGLYWTCQRICHEPRHMAVFLPRPEVSRTSHKSQKQINDNKWSSIYRSTARLNHSLHLKKLLQCSTIYHCSINVHPNSIQWAPSHKSCSKDTAFNDWAAPSCERREMLSRLSISSLQQPKLPIVYGAVLIALPRIDDKNFFFLLRGWKLLRNTKGVHLWSSFFQCLLPAARHQASLALCKKKLVSE